ncbi:MAG: TatD family hydrolase [Anaerolineales bacterium]|nr:TatD family hydrolase [Anaerolineales bacterium]
MDFDSFNRDRADVIARARDAGLARILNPGVDLASSQAAAALADSCLEVYAAVGVHPNDGLAWNERASGELRALAGHPKVVAIGEIGLDYYRDRTPQDVQRRIFQQQLELAAEVGLPVVIHSRNASAIDQRATRDVLSLLADWRKLLQVSNPELALRPGVLHSYSGSLEDARRAADLGFWIGVAGPVTFPKAEALRALVKAMPLERLLIETDAPFLTPQPFRGKRNEPVHVRYVAEKIAHIHTLPYERVVEITTANAERLFHWQMSS